MLSMTKVIDTYNYDKKFDTLYYTIGDPRNSYGDEDIDDIVILKNLDTDEIVGITILNFMRHYKNGKDYYADIADMIDIDAIAMDISKY